MNDKKREKAIELVKENEWCRSSPSLRDKNNHPKPTCIVCSVPKERGAHDKQCWLGKLISLLQRPSCKTCGGIGVVDTRPCLSGLDNLTETDVPCPDCKGTGIQPDCSPSAGEFAKEFMARLAEDKEFFLEDEIPEDVYKTKISFIIANAEVACNLLIAQALKKG